MLTASEFFQDVQESFTVYVVEQRFVVGRGFEYFRSFRGKDNFISTERAVKRNISNVLKWIQRNTPNMAELIKSTLQLSSPVGIVDVISSLSKLFTVNQHQAAGPEVLDPIIIQEGEISQKHLSQLISLHKDSILQPAIIILLKDNNFERAKQLLSKCPHGMNVKMIRNSGASEIYKVINIGADSIDEFVDSFAKQCFSTCSKTKRGILTNTEWAGNSPVRLFSPRIFGLRANLLLDEKDADVLTGINDTIDQLSQYMLLNNTTDDKLILSLICILKLFRVYCNDAGNNDIYDAYSIAKHLNNELLLAHVYRYSFFLKNLPLSQRQELLLRGAETFRRNGVEDHAIYSMNNYLTQQMYQEHINPRPFKELLEEAIYNVPGLVGMSYIFNNTGVVSIYTGKPEEAIEYFSKGSDYAKDRIVPWLALQNNKLIAKDSSYISIDEREIISLVERVFSVMGTDRLPFISANIITNCLVLANRHYKYLFNQILHDYPVISLYNRALTPAQMGSGSLFMQLQLLAHESELPLDDVRFPQLKAPIAGARLKFIEQKHLNPVIFHTWL